MDVLLLSVPVFLAVGVVTGVVAGLFGVGGGLVVVPVLAALLPRLGAAAPVLMQVAVGTSLATIAVTSVSSMGAHRRRDGVVWPLFWQLGTGIVGGALLGARIAHMLPSAVLQRAVGAGMLALAVQMALDFKPRGARAVPGAPAVAACGAAIGGLSTLIGIGGGSMTVPLLSWWGLEMRKSVGTSAACGVPIAWAGALGFVLNGAGVAGRPPWSLGYVDLPAFAAIACTSLLTAPLGARLAHRLPPAVHRRGFAAFLTLVGLKMLLA
jgi:uncharacterized membrane protein YfcA